MNWHGKPLGAKSDEVLASLKEIITNNGPVGLSAEEPTEECPTVSMSVKLSEPPSYKEGEKVVIFNRCVLFPIIFMLLSYIYAAYIYSTDSFVFNSRTVLIRK